MSNEKNFIRLVDAEGFDSKIDLKDNSDLLFLLKNLKVGTRVQIRLDGWFGLNSEIVAFDEELLD